jgi:hypothetical protein
VTLAGTLAAALLLESVTVAPPAGAAAVSETVPVAGWPPWTRLGLTLRLDSETAIGTQPGSLNEPIRVCQLFNRHLFSR